MIPYSELKKGLKIVLDGASYEILEARALKKAQGRVIIQTRIKNLITGNVFSRNFHQGDVFEKAEISKFEARFLYSHRGRYFFCQKDIPAKRFNLAEEQIGPSAKFLKPDQTVEGITFERKIINIFLPIKVNLKVIEAPPGVKEGRTQPGTKTVTLESGAKVNVPLFVKEGDIIEINTETGEYVRRIE